MTILDKPIEGHRMVIYDTCRKVFYYAGKFCGLLEESNLEEIVKEFPLLINSSDVDIQFERLAEYNITENLVIVSVEGYNTF